MAINIAQMLGQQGADSGQYTPQDVARRRLLAERLSGNTVQDAGAIGALANTLSGTLSGYEDTQAATMEAEGQNAARERLIAALNDPGGGIAGLATVASDPFLSQSSSGIASALLGQKIEQQDPMYQLQLQQAQLELEQARNPAAKNPYINVGGGSVFNQSTGEFITAPGVGGESLPNDVKEYNWYAEAETAAGRQPLSYLDFVNAQKGAGLSITTNPDGTTSIVQGGPGKPLTEGQSKDTVYSTRAAGALPIIDQFGEALMNPAMRAVENDPTGIARGMQSPEFQQAQQAGKEFLQAILRKDTGAAITPQETAEYGSVYLPIPGDSPVVLEQKRVSRKRALEAINAGLPPQAILAQEIALQNSGAAQPPPESDEEGWQDLGNGIRIRPIGQ